MPEIVMKRFEPMLKDYAKLALAQVEVKGCPGSS